MGNAPPGSGAPTSLILRTFDDPFYEWNNHWSIRNNDANWRKDDEFILQQTYDMNTQYSMLSTGLTTRYTGVGQNWQWWWSTNSNGFKIGVGQYFDHQTLWTKSTRYVIGYVLSYDGCQLIGGDIVESQIENCSQTKHWHVSFNVAPLMGEAQGTKRS